MERLRAVTLVAQLLFSVCAVSGDTINFFHNGGRWEDATPFTIDEEDARTAASISELIDMVAQKNSLVGTPEITEKTRLFNSHGLEVKDVAEVTPADEYFFLPYQKHWMWSSYTHGRKVEFANDDVIPAKDPSGNFLPNLALESVNLSPRVFFIHNLLSDQEAEDLVEHASTRVKQSTVGSVDIRKDPGRTSDGTFDSSIPASKAIIQRVYKLLRVPYKEVTVDGLQIVRYNTGKFYNEHMDYLDDQNATPENSMVHATGGTNRYATVFFYLNDVPAGGQTGFTKASHLTDEQLAKLSPELQPVLSSHKVDYNESQLYETIGRDFGMESNMVKACHEKLSVRPVKLGAVLFYNTDPMLVHDKMTLHAGCPVIEGIKWGANLWVWDDNKSGKGVPASLNLEIMNKHPQPIKVFWVGPQERLQVSAIRPGESSKHVSYNRHIFEFEIQGKVVDRFNLLFSNGFNQRINVPLDGPQPVYREVHVDFINKLATTLTTYWYNPDTKEEVFLGQFPGFGVSAHGTFHGHEFRIREGNNVPNGRLILRHVIDGSKGENQNVDVEEPSGSLHDEL